MKRVIKLDISEVKPGMRLAQTIYTGSQTVLLESGQIITADYIRRLKNYAIRTVIIEEESPAEEALFPEIKDSNDDNYFTRQNFIRREIPQKAGIEMSMAQIDSEEKLTQRFGRSHRDLEEITWASFQELKNYNRLNLDNFKKSLEKMIDELNEEANIRQQQTSLECESEYLYMHSANVAIYSLIIGLALKLAKEELIELGLSALLHDVGMLKVPDEIRHKADELTVEEYEEVKKHSSYSREMLEKLPQMSSRILKAVSHHHERVDGSGYPNRLLRDEIDLFSKIIAISDTFDSLSSTRPHREKMQKHDALKECLRICKNSFDENYLEKFLFNVPLYPVGTKVRLNNGEEGVVSKASFNPFRPTVDIIVKQERYDRPRKRRVNLALSQNSGLRIDEILEDKITC